MKNRIFLLFWTTCELIDITFIAAKCRGVSPFLFFLADLGVFTAGLLTKEKRFTELLGVL